MSILRFLLLATLVYLVWRAIGPQLVDSRPRRASGKRLPRVNGRDPREILGVGAKATAAEITAAYRKKISQFHPDKMARMSDEVRAMSEERTRELNQAYEILKGR
ncbi:MAG: J domain-containing protein [Polyangiaceae bacterium]